MAKIKNRIGETNINKYGSKMTIVEYKGSNDIIVQFEQGNLVHTSYTSFMRCSVKNVYDLTVFGIGYIGEGVYKTSVGNKLTKQYVTWHSMMRRCYDENFLNKHTSYMGCSVIKKWHNFQNFAQWYENNFYEIEGETMHLDKDILAKGSKIYSPDTCVFVPQSINKLLIKSESIRGELPIGVSFHKRKHNKRYIARCNVGGDFMKNIGYFDTPEEAFEAYKVFKENYIKEVANTYKDKIPSFLYDVLNKYEVGIND